MSDEKFILIVDDEEDVRDIVVMRLLTHRLNTYYPIVATDGYEALECLRSQAIALVLLDIRMRNLNGMEVCRQMSVDRDLKKIPVVISSGYLDEEEKKELQKMGIQHFLNKPYTMEQLLKTLDAILNPAN